MEQKQFWFLNEQPIPGDPNVVLPTILASIPDLQYWSTDAIQELYIGALHMAEIIAKEEKKTKKGATGSKLTRFINSIPNRLKFIPSDHAKILELAYSQILSFEGLSTLSGFGVTNHFGDYIAGNPEVKSIIKKENYS